MAADTIDITWQDLVLSHEGPYKVARIGGWEETPSPRVDDQSRPNAHGSFDAPIWAGSRTVTVEGYCHDQAERDTLLQGLRATMVPTGDSSGLQDLTVTFAGQTLSARARVLRCGAVLDLYGIGRIGWQIDWWAPDPLRYAATQNGSTGLPSNAGGLSFPLFATTGVLDFGGLSAPGQVSLSNPGTAATWPTFTVTGPLPGGFELVELTTGSRLRWETDVPAGVQVTLDARTGAVSYGGQPGYDGALTVRQWWSVPAGGSRLVQINPLGASDPAAGLQVSWAPAYW